jgi:hypothetical protein
LVASLADLSIFTCRKTRTRLDNLLSEVKWRFQDLMFVIAELGLQCRETFESSQPQLEMSFHRSSQATGMAAAISPATRTKPYHSSLYGSCLNDSLQLLYS